MRRATLLHRGRALNFRKIIPLASLALVGSVVVAAAFYDPPSDFPYTEPPEGPPLEAPDLQVGRVTFHGVVTAQDGAPLEGAGVSLDQNGRPYFTWTRADGRFELDELSPGPAEVRVVALGFQATSFAVDELGRTSAAAPYPLALLRPVGAPPPVPEMALGDLQGTVVFGPHATPRRGYELLLAPTAAPEDPTGGFPRRILLDETGTFEVHALQEGEYRAILLAPEDRGGREPDLLARGDSDGVTFRFEAGDELPPLTLESTAASVTGRAFTTGADAESLGVRSALIRAEPIVEGDAGRGRPSSDRSMFRATRTDADGRYVLRDLVPGRYRISLVAGLTREERTIELQPGDSMRVEFGIE